MPDYLLTVALLILAIISLRELVSENIWKNIFRNRSIFSTSLLTFQKPAMKDTRDFGSDFSFSTYDWQHFILQSYKETLM